MYCSHLSLVNFRNYARLELDLPPGVSIVVGDNAQGKSNLLEALYFLATTKSFRAASDRELINWRALDTELAYTRLIARVERGPSRLKLEAVIREDGRLAGSSAESGCPAVAKRLKLNDVPRRALDVVGAVNVVMFSPRDIELIDGPPTARRRYLDVTISQVNSRYIRTLAHYNKVLVQRNHLLRQIRERRSQPDQLYAWDHELLDAGAYLIQQRQATLASLAEMARDFHRQLTGRQEVLDIVYRPSLDLSPVGSGASTDAIHEAFRVRLRAAQSREFAAGVSILGPHRDDLAFLVDGRDMNAFGSRGQQRTVALALKLAEADFLRERTADQPILLLDDVLSELDEPRRRHVLSTITPGQQVIFTTTDLEPFEGELLDRAAVYRVTEGVLESRRVSLDPLGGHGS